MGRVVSHEGLLAVELPAGKRQIDLTFWPRAFVFGFWVSLCGVCAAVALALGRTRGSLALA